MSASDDDLVERIASMVEEAFLVTGLEPTQRGPGNSFKDGCALTALGVANGAGRSSGITCAMRGIDVIRYALGLDYRSPVGNVGFGWDSYLHLPSCPFYRAGHLAWQRMHSEAPAERVPGNRAVSAAEPAVTADQRLCEQHYL